jgi:hypothetical protein
MPKNRLISGTGQCTLGAARRRGRPSQGPSVGEYVWPDRRVHAGIRKDVDFSFKEVFEVLTEGDQIEQRAASVHLNQQIEITVGEVFSTRRRTKHTDIAGAVAHGDSKDVVPFVLKIHRSRLHFSSTSAQDCTIHEFAECVMRKGAAGCGTTR